MSTQDSQDVYLKRARTRQKLIKLISFSKLVSEVTRHHLYCIKSIRNESPNSVHFQEKGIFDSTLEGRHVGSFVDIFSSPHKRDKQDIY